jgi:hypothetical protein
MVIQKFDLYRELRSVGFETFIRCFELFKQGYQFKNRHELGDAVLLYLDTTKIKHKGKPYAREASHAMRIFDVGLELQALQLCIDAPRLDETLKAIALNYFLTYQQELDIVEEENSLSVMETDAFQNKVTSITTVKTIDTEKLCPITTPPKLKVLTSQRWRRSPRIAKESLQLANYQCEVDSNHLTFISSVSKSAYMEAHHLIPMQAQVEFDFSLDVHSNIVSLCPNCHRKVHLAITSQKSDVLVSLLEKKRQILSQQCLELSADKLLNYYR